MNRQIGGQGFQICNVFDPLLTGHVIRRMRSGRVRIFNGYQRETLYLVTQERIGVGSSYLVAVAAIQVVQVVRCTRAHDPWGPTSEDQIAIFLKNLFLLFLTLPVTVATAERSFSKLKLIKTYLRNINAG